MQNLLSPVESESEIQLLSWNQPQLQVNLSLTLAHLSPSLYPIMFIVYDNISLSFDSSSRPPAWPAICPPGVVFDMQDISSTCIVTFEGLI